MTSNIRGCLLTAALSPLLSIGCAAQEIGKPDAMGNSETAPTWAEVLGKTIVLHARHSMPGVEVDLKVGSKRFANWGFIAFDTDRIVTLTFTRRGAKTPAASYLLAPWQPLHWRGPAAECPDLITVNRDAIVFGPVSPSDGDETTDAIRSKSRSIVAEFAGAEWCNQGTKIGEWPRASLKAMDPVLEYFDPIHSFRPYYLQVDYHIAEPGHPYFNLDGWKSVVQERLVVLMGHGPGRSFRINCYPPKVIDRSRPQPFDPGEQRLAPDVNLKSAAEQMDRAICEIFNGAVSRALALPDEAADFDRPRILQMALPALEQAVFSYPGHTGPAHAAGATALAMWHQRLSNLLIDETISSYDKGHWPSNLISYAPGLLQKLRNLPPATPDYVNSLRKEFVRYQLSAAEHPGMAAAELMSYMPSDEEMLLAEIGDRLRTALAKMPRDGEVEKVVSYPGFKFFVSHPLEGKRQLQAKGPTEVKMLWR